MNLMQRCFPLSASSPIVAGAFLCLGFAWLKGFEPQAAAWIEVLLVVAVLILMPLARQLQAGNRALATSRDDELYPAVLLMMSLLSGRPWWLSVALACPWLLIRGRDAYQAWQDGYKTTDRTPGLICHLSARIFPVIGAAWLIPYRAGWMPFGFDGLIVLLTAAHFHHAGFTLPLMAGLCEKALPGRLSRGACSLILAGVPLVAVGITCTHFKVLPWVEPLSVCVLVAGALGVALLQMRMAFRQGISGWGRALFVVSGLSLFIAMLLALGFGLRYFLPAGALSMPGMWAIHGSLNTFGFGLGGILAWRGLHKTP